MAPSATNNKINIYPIEVTIDAAGVVHKGNCLKINDTGMIMEVFTSAFNPQQLLKLKWLLPIDNIAMEEDAVVIKKYTQNRSGQLIYLMEVHFKKLKFSNASAIFSLLNRHDDDVKKQAGKLTVEGAEKPQAPSAPVDEKKKK